MHRLAFLIPGDLSTPTGGYVYDRRMAEGLRMLGWQVDLHVLDASFPTPTSAALVHAREVLRRIPGGSLVLIDGLALGGMPELASAEAQRLRLVALIHHPLAKETGLEPSRATALRDAERRALATVSGILVTSRYTAGVVRELGVAPGRIRVVEPGTDRVKPARGSLSDTLELLCVAALTPRKGHRVLFDALGGLLQRRWRLVCVGSLERDANTAREARRRIELLGLPHRVQLVGELDDAALAKCYFRADLFVLPTFFEGYGMALTEALARGLPVISTSAGAVPDTVPAEAGILVPPGDVVSLRQALARVMEDGTLRRRLSAGARTAGRALPTWTRAYRRMSAALERIVVA